LLGAENVTSDEAYATLLASRITRELAVFVEVNKLGPTTVVVSSPPIMSGQGYYSSISVSSESSWTTWAKTIFLWYDLGVDLSNPVTSIDYPMD
jgi:hypothetical protein